MSRVTEELEYLRELARQEKLWGVHLVIEVPLREGDRWMVELYNDPYGGMGEQHTHESVWRLTGSTLEETIQKAVRTAERKATR